MTVAPLHPGSIATMLFLLLMACRTTMLSGAEADENARRAYNELLGEVVTEDGYVDYDALEANRGPLDRFVASLAEDENGVGKKAKHRHAYWLNAYNALVLFQVLERGRPESVLDVGGWIPKGGSGFFLETQFDIGGDYLSLSEIEHERVRQMELDYRDHAALNCASMSCPPLRNELYATPRLQQQLREQMRRWIMDDERGLRIEGDTLVVNPIFEWFHRDFVFFSAGMNVCELAATYAVDNKRRAIDHLAEGDCKVRSFEYDWSLNDAAKR